MRDYIKLMRPFHWVKNLLIFVPLFFSGRLFTSNKITDLIIAFLAFSLIASSVYVLNDIKDADKDRLHPKKKYRPIASGHISKAHALMLWALLIVISICLMALLVRVIDSFYAALSLPIVYMLINVLYSNGLKNVPLLDVAIIAAGFVIRLYYGAVVCGILISDSLLLTVISASFFLGFGKRRNELKKGTSTRKVLQAYNIHFLDKIMYVFIGLTLVFYSLWTITRGNNLVYTVPFSMLIVADYCLIIESNSSDGDPAEVLKHSKTLMCLLVLFVVFMFICLYVNP
ncbi:phosphoribose diphosphate decaprenyl-phosphate phosphoribosyltransferase family protein [Limosilactobacillus frumenti DSM 13145]|uniref:Phosphoribose diphosphate decaprenyl-phosphate phosphoribosyltransferase family protein n=1 Tax=Limosilactobacillus frumenti DSM 13145 TaxID=1423746 RepID=A0A0R1P881_9LACO|nr:UbiA prenyltransferase family protein [Limosilactobacillus frumenti]KRL26194.1 phosphoribose diphosphate decaprenyl-phosphate phosphoribosyltransferase family protein [Limosilactobacillus frumenti DSM 13145]QFG72948.1 UbiA prenyltransferase family protein [Limosilactobacillus frumenti]